MAKALINLDALRSNYHFLKNLAPKSNALAVIKADAYGHGMLKCAQALSDADGFAVARIEEAVHLRGSGIKNKILLLEGVFSEKSLEKAIELDIDIVFHDKQQLVLLDAIQNNTEKKLNCWVKINTGMNRLGYSLAELAAVAEKLSQYPFLNIEVLMTHFANADAGKSGEINEVLKKFEQVKKTFPQVKKFSLANSAAIFEFPESHAAWNRPGISLYGASTLEKNISELLPVMQLSAPVLAIHQVAKGEAVGYGSTWTATKDTHIAVLGIGYGDGYPRHAKNGTPVSIAGKEYKLAGRVSMDMITLDLEDNAQGVQVGDTAILWGSTSSGMLSADLIAKHADTISYELFCGVTQRVIKEYIGG